MTKAQAVAVGKKPAGLAHILEEHSREFDSLGIAPDQVPDFVMKAATEGRVIGYQGKGMTRPIVEFTYDGQPHQAAITVGSNGFVVGMNMQ